MHYKTIKFNIKIPLNIQFSFLRRATRKKFDIAHLRADLFWGIFHIPPPPIRKMDRRRCSAPPPPTSKKLPTPLRHFT